MANTRTKDRTLQRAQFQRLSSEQCQRILVEHKSEPRPQDAAQAVHTIVERAEAQYENAKG